MSVPKLEVIAPPAEPVIISRRIFLAPASLLYDAWTRPEHLKRWFGPKRNVMIGCDVDLRIGGSYHYLFRGPDGSEFGFHGTYRELDPPRRMVCTFVFDGSPENEAIDTVTWEAVEGGTLVTTHTLYPSLEVRNGNLAYGIETGVTEAYGRLDALVHELPSGTRAAPRKSEGEPA